jgi:radical SAM superfamily enzyme YgiQ (UPF0313 family)
MGLCRIACALEREGFQVRVLDLCFVTSPPEEIHRVCEDFRPEAVGLSVRNIDDVDSLKQHFYLEDVRRDMVAPLRKYLPEIPLIVGGASVGVAPEEVLRYLGGDYAVAGDGERAAVALFSSLREGATPDSIPGVLERQGEDLRIEPGEFLKDLDSFPPAQAYRWINWEAYSSYGGRYGIQTKRGCDRACVYCSYPKIEGRQYRLRDPKRVVDEIEEALREGGVDRFEFVDSTFNIPRDHALAVCRELADRELGINIDAMGLNPAGVDRELLDVMMAAGFTEVACTIESGSRDMLRSLGKAFSPETAAEAAKLLSEVGLPTKWYLMFGGPGESRETVLETFKFVDDHVPDDHLVIAMTGIRVLPHTSLERRARKELEIPDDESLIQPHYYWGSMEEEDLKALVAEEISRRPKCCNASGELWNNPRLMRLVVFFRRLLKRSGTGWGAVRLMHRIRSLFR